MKLRRSKKQEVLPQENVVKKQAERIDELRRENDSLTARLEEYRRHEKEISDVVVFAKKKQEEYLADLRVRYALENERLRRFCETMECYKSKDALMKAYDESFGAVKKAREELERILREDLGEGAEEYLSEKRRLRDPDLPFITEERMARSDLSKASALTEEELQELLDQI